VGVIDCEGVNMSKVKLSSAVISITEKLPNGAIIESEVGIDFDIRSYIITQDKRIVFTLHNGYKVSSPITSYKAEKITEKKRK
jgi:hypothetical protein